MSLTISELVVYTPAKDFEVSKSFYTALGFELTEGFGDTMDCRLGNAVFRLQNYYVQDLANNFMMKLQVDDVDEWYEHVKKVVGDGKYGSARLSAPEMVGGAKLLHVVDPSGVLLIFVQ
ncbi:MAG: glyoxalase [Acidobacteria bacterium]|nr:glyoxalase [Acidobacteriota bacterium]